MTATAPTLRPAPQNLIAAPLSSRPSRARESRTGGGAAWRVRQTLGGIPRRQMMRFAAVGLASTLLQGGLYLVAHSFMASSLAVTVSLVLSTMANTAANRTFTFAAASRTSTSRTQWQGLLLLGITWAMQNLGLWLISPLELTSAMESVAVMVSGTSGGVIRFALMRRWMFR